MHKFQDIAVLHFWRLIPPDLTLAMMVTLMHLGCTDQLWGSPGAGGGELESAHTCGPWAVPPSAAPVTAATCTPGQGDHSPSPLPRRAHQEAAGSPCLPSDLAQAQRHGACRAGTCSTTSRALSEGLKAAHRISQTPKHCAVSRSEKPLLTEMTAQRYPSDTPLPEGSAGSLSLPDQSCTL